MPRRLAICLALLGCGEAHAAGERIVAILGDSLSLSYGDELQALLGSGYQVVNLSVGGTSTFTIRHSQWVPYVEDCGYYAAVVLGGVNDIRGSQPLTYTQEHLGAIYGDARRVQRFFALTTTPIPSQSPSWIITNQSVPPMNDWIRSQASPSVRVIDAWAAFGGASPDNDLYQVDLIHPDSDGDAVLADIVADAILAP